MALLAVDRQQRLGLLELLDGQRWNHKRVHRVYCALRLNLPRRSKRRLPTRLCQPLDAPARLNTTWALDFMSDRLYDGRPFCTLNVIDEAIGKAWRSKSAPR